MSITSSNKQANQSGLRTVAYISAVIGGGVVGTDYAAWLKVNPVVGALLGSAISTALTKFLFHLRDDEEPIRKLCTSIGVCIGGVAGISTGLSDPGGVEGFFAGLLVGACLGAIAGQLVAALISFGAIALLFTSRGPVGLFLRNLILNQNNDETSGCLFNYLDLDSILCLLSFCDALDAI